MKQQKAINRFVSFFAKALAMIMRIDASRSNLVSDFQYGGESNQLDAEILARSPGPQAFFSTLTYFY